MNRSASPNGTNSRNPSPNGANSRNPSTNSTLDLHSPYYLHPCENPIISIVNVTLTASNYHSWSRNMRVALKYKNKLQFIDGTLTKPEETDSNFLAWEKCNTYAVAWLNLSLSSEISQSVIWNENAYDMWNDLKHRYHQGDIFRIVDLEEEMYTAKQGELSITAYFTKLRIIWEELKTFLPIPSCVCGVECTCDLGVMRKYRKQRQLVRLLRSLNEEYGTVRSQIILMAPLPDVNAVFGMLTQQERQFHSLDNGEPRALISSSDLIENEKHFQHQNANGYRGRGHSSRGRDGRGGRGPLKLCSFCHKTGHLVDTCYKKYGPPLHMRQPQKAFNYATTSPGVKIDKSSEALLQLSTQKRECKTSTFSLSQEQKDTLIALIQQDNSSQIGHVIN
ncbi:uncharacterized protein LOC130969610 [Arachis stenosperma]|uniref:uncharacterized protein LOC130969610 n=1 Tax=Arachis stenosperma TaxID=217475 RepID=UPI0025ABDF5C|nr:uncharacterized protein LOC130969610 [Arachis stenosperma]